MPHGLYILDCHVYDDDDEDDDDDDLQVVKNNLNPSWKKFTLSLQTFCSGDLDAPLKVHTHARTCTRTYTHDQTSGTHSLSGRPERPMT